MQEPKDESLAGPWTPNLRLIGRELFNIAALPTLLISLLLGLCVAFSTTDLFIDRFWRHSATFRWGLTLAGTLFFSLPLLPAVRRLISRPFSATRPAERIAWMLILLCLMTLVIAVLEGTMKNLSLQAVHDFRAIYPSRTYPSPTQCTEIGLLFFLAILVNIPGANRRDRKLNPLRWVYIPLLFLAFCFLGIQLINNVLPSIDTKHLEFAFPETVPALPLIGRDFRVGLYEPAKLLLSGSYLYASQGWDINAYPPLTAVLALPYLLFDETTAYLAHLILLVIANIACLALATLLARDHAALKAAPGEVRVDEIHVTLFVLLAFNLFSAYPFLFSIERGNSDIVAMAFAMLAIWVLLKRPRRIWLQVLLLSVAVHIKVYPVLLFPLLYFVHRSKIIVPSALVNLGLLLVLGPANAVGFLHNISQLGNNPPVIGVANNSGYSFADVLAPLVSSAIAPPAVRAVLLTIIPVLIWVVAWLPLARLQKREHAVLLGFMITLPVMETVPSTSNDYKLVILSAGVLILFSTILMRMTIRQTLSDYVKLLSISGVVLWIGRSFTLTDPSLSILRNKYPWVILLEILMLATIFQELRDASRETQPLDAPDAEPIPV